MHSIWLCISKYSYLGISAALGLGILGLPIPDETLLAYAGFLVLQGKLNYLYAIIACFIGTSCGIQLDIYLVGYLKL
ncbi:MAG: hypothetical protein ABSB79_03140 [Syntrophales bacterium]|jgi:membrane protein DedA with SNARE-associated domain